MVPVSSTRSETLVSSSRSSRRAQVARGDELPFPPREWRRIDRKNHRQRRLVDRQRFERRGIREIGNAFADLDAFDARDRHDVAREYLFGFIAFEPAEREKFRDLRRLNFPVELGDADFRAALQRALKNARDRQSPEEIAVIEVRHLNLQHALGIARRRRNRRDDLLEKRLQRGRAVVQVHVRHADLRVGVDHRKIELVFGRIEIDEEIVDFIEHFGRTRVGPIDFVQDHDRRQLGRERLLQDVARLRQRPFARVHQHQHAIHHAQRALHFAAEIAVAGRVDDIDLRAAIGNRGILREDRDAALALEVIRVHHALDQFLVRPENAALPQHGVDERRLPMIHVGDDGDIAYGRRHGVSLRRAASAEKKGCKCSLAAPVHF